MVVEKEDKKKEADDLLRKLEEEILKTRDSVLEEFDMIELIEDSIKDVFDCSLDCSNCSRENMGKCMQAFKKGNLYWLRKIAQDEFMLKNIVEKMDVMHKILVKMVKQTKNVCLPNEDNDKKFKERREEVKKKVRDCHGFNYFT